MKNNRALRSTIIAVCLLTAVGWSLVSASKPGQSDGPYAESGFYASAAWLKETIGAADVVVVDVRSDEYFDGKLIAGAVRLPWASFRTDLVSADTASVFVGVAQAQQILGRHGIARTDTVVLYDSVARDGGATASYVFWVLDLLGHKEMRVLDGGIDAWARAGGDIVREERVLNPILYQARSDELRLGKRVTGSFVRERLGDPFYQILDVRSQAEYAGEEGTEGLRGNPLKLGHIPTAYNINYEDAWQDQDTKLLHTPDTLRRLYGGLDRARAVIVYCNSGRRSSYTYYVLRLLGFRNITVYEASWQEWGNRSNYFPVEQAPTPLPDGTLAEGLGADAAAEASDTAAGRHPTPTYEPATSEPEGGYVSCGG